MTDRSLVGGNVIVITAQEAETPVVPPPVPTPYDFPPAVAPTPRDVLPPPTPSFTFPGPITAICNYSANRLAIACGADIYLVKVS